MNQREFMGWSSVAYLLAARIGLDVHLPYAALVVAFIFQYVHPFALIPFFTWVSANLRAPFNPQG